MHIDYTVHFWTLLGQATALGSFLLFLWKVYKAIRSVVDATKAILNEHREVYDWYSETVKGKLWPTAGD